VLFGKRVKGNTLFLSEALSSFERSENPEGSQGSGRRGLARRWSVPRPIILTGTTRYASMRKTVAGKHERGAERKTLAPLQIDGIHTTVYDMFIAVGDFTAGERFVEWFSDTHNMFLISPSSFDLLPRNWVLC